VTKLTAEQIKRLLTFRGYGNPSGRFWFVGMEEGGGDIESLRIRADKFSTLEDLAESHKRFDSHDMSNLISTWRIMSAIVGRISGIADWWDPDYARDYQAKHLGRTDGETYLTEILPLPKRSLDDWPYGDIFDSPKDYFKQVFPDQRDSLQVEYEGADPKPQFVFCYGKKYWPHHREIFDFVKFQPALSGKIQWGQNESTVFILTNFFGYGWTGFGEDFVDSLCEFAINKSSLNWSGRS
jgi:hypothetical protein